MAFLLAIAGFLLGPMLTRLANLALTGKPQISCPYCQSPFRSWFALKEFVSTRGRCASCGAPYLLPYALAEILTPAVFFLVWQKFGFTPYTPFALLCGAAFVILFITDVTHRRLPDAVIFPTIILALTGESLKGSADLLPRLQNHFAGGVLSFLLFFAFYTLGQAFARWKSIEEVAFGMGDVKLALLIGTVLGYPEGLRALLAGVFLNGAAALAIMLRGLASRRFNPSAPFPYGPGLILSFFIFWLFPL